MYKDSLQRTRGLRTEAPSRQVDDLGDVTVMRFNIIYIMRNIIVRPQDQFPSRFQAHSLALALCRWRAWQSSSLLAAWTPPPLEVLHEADLRCAFIIAVALRL